jgi:hypothetical protein
MGSNLNSGSMQQSRHNNFERNHCLMKISAKKCLPLGCLPSKALITKEMRGTESGHKLHYIVGKYCLQQVGLVSSGQRRKLDLSVRMSGCTLLDFCRFSDSAVRDCCLVKRMMLWIWIFNVKQIQAIFSTKEIPEGSSPDSQPPITENAIFVKSHVKKWLFSLPRGGEQARNLSNAK